MPTISQLQEADRDDLVQGVKWHGGRGLHSSTSSLNLSRFCH
jgi:hypothetical protein